MKKLINYQKGLGNLEEKLGVAKLRNALLKHLLEKEAFNPTLTYEEVSEISDDLIKEIEKRK